MLAGRLPNFKLAYARFPLIGRSLGKAFQMIRQVLICRQMILLKDTQFARWIRLFSFCFRDMIIGCDGLFYSR